MRDKLQNQKGLIASIRREMPPSRQVFKAKKSAAKADATGRKAKYRSKDE